MTRDPPWAISVTAASAWPRSAKHSASLSSRSPVAATASSSRPESAGWLARNLTEPSGSRRASLHRHGGRQPDGEGRTLARLARRVNVAAHQPGEPPADGEPQARAAVSALARHTGLAEVLKQPVHLIRRDADTRIVHGKEHRSFRLAPCLERHRSGLGELARV